jgi:uncharacterized damage-inducible protein DinB
MLALFICVRFKNKHNMEIIPILLNELEQEAQRTRKMFAVVPDNKYDWRPHPKSMTIKDLVTHIADLPNWVGLAIETDGLDFAVSPYNPENIDNTEELLTCYERNIAENTALLKKITEQDLIEPWTLSNGDYIINKYNRLGAIRVALSQTIHHRAQLGVNLRLLNIPIPGSYGPSADELGL